jgi:hypothetical protein
MKRSTGMGHQAAVRALAYKWIRIIFRCWKNRVCYKDEIYIRALNNNGSAVIGFMKQAA